MNIISHITVDKKIIELRDNFVIIDRDVAELLEVPEDYDADTETSVEVNFGDCLNTKGQLKRYIKTRTQNK